MKRKQISFPYYTSNLDGTIVGQSIPFLWTSPAARNCGGQTWTIAYKKGYRHSEDDLLFKLIQDAIQDAIEAGHEA